MRVANLLPFMPVLTRRQHARASSVLSTSVEPAVTQRAACDLVLSHIRKCMCKYPHLVLEGDMALPAAMIAAARCGHHIIMPCPSPMTKHKDAFAQFVLETMGIDLSGRLDAVSTANALAKKLKQHAAVPVLVTPFSFLSVSPKMSEIAQASHENTLFMHVNIDGAQGLHWVLDMASGPVSNDTIGHLQEEGTLCTLPAADAFVIDETGYRCFLQRHAIGVSPLTQRCLTLLLRLARQSTDALQDFIELSCQAQWRGSINGALQSWLLGWEDGKEDGALPSDVVEAAPRDLKQYCKHLLSDGEVIECCLCMVGMDVCSRDASNLVVRLSCGHWFHYFCTTRWFAAKRAPTCGMCRQKSKQMTCLAPDAASSLSSERGEAGAAEDVGDPSGDECDRLDTERLERAAHASTVWEEFEGSDGLDSSPAMQLCVLPAVPAPRATLFLSSSDVCLKYAQHAFTAADIASGLSFAKRPDTPMRVDASQLLIDPTLVLSLMSWASRCGGVTLVVCDLGVTAHMLNVAAAATDATLILYPYPDMPAMKLLADRGLLPCLSPSVLQYAQSEA